MSESRSCARIWWETSETRIAFTRFTQISLLRLLTTAAAMDGAPLRMNDAWRVHDRLYEDERVVFYPEPADVEDQFRAQTKAATAHPSCGPTLGCSLSPGPLQEPW